MFILCSRSIRLWMLWIYFVYTLIKLLLYTRLFKTLYGIVPFIQQDDGTEKDLTHTIHAACQVRSTCYCTLSYTIPLITYHSCYSGGMLSLICEGEQIIIHSEWSSLLYCWSSCCFHRMRLRGLPVFLLWWSSWLLNSKTQLDKLPTFFTSKCVWTIVWVATDGFHINSEN